MPQTSISFDASCWYRPTDPAMLVIGATSTLARWRSEHRGPSFTKVGTGRSSRILYSGAALIAWLESQSVPVGA